MVGLVLAALVVCWVLWRGEFFQEYGLKIYLALPSKYTFGAPPQAATSAGRVEGRWCYSQQGRVCAAFSAVPYAAPPVGELRFKRPQPPTPWQGVRRCITSSTFIQKNIFRYGSPREGTEDALHLNIYSPSFAQEEVGTVGNKPLLPVMVFFHGGGFVSGSGSRLLYGPELLLDKEVVLVTPNFRVSVLGGLYIEGEAPGNQMLRDQIAALQWVSRNIQNFGGDPTRVTIFGESAGGACVVYHLLSPASKGLFNAAIVQSGSPLSPLSGLEKHPSYYSSRLGECLGAPLNATPSALVKFLRGVPAFTLQSKAYMFERFMRNPLPFKPIVDGGLVEDPILPLEPTELLATGAWNKVPVILGHNKDEGLLAKGFFQHIGGRQRRNWIELALLSFFGRENLEEATLEEIEEVTRFKKLYLGRGMDTGSALVRMYGDFLFKTPTNNLAQALASQPGPPIFFYHFTHQVALSLYDCLHLPPFQFLFKVFGLRFWFDWLWANTSLDWICRSNDGVCHADELFMLFKPHQVPVTMVRSDVDKRVSSSMLQMWTDFAKVGNPTPGDGTWQKVDPDQMRYLEIGSAGNQMNYTEEYRAGYDEWRGMWERNPISMGNIKTWTAEADDCHEK